jgi:uncharacterized protein YaiI (UPF0178 family)
VTITLTEDPSQVTVGADLLFTPVNWMTPQTVTVTAVDDTVVETTPHGTVIAHGISSADGQYTALAPLPDTTVDITDNDVPGVTVSPLDTSATEDVGDTASYEVVLDSSPRPGESVTVTVVPDGPDAADKWIADRIGPGDVCVTADVPLAARAVERGARVLAPDGAPFTPANVGVRLATRDLMADLRAADPFRQGGNRPFGKADRARFLQALDRALHQAARDRPG